MMTNPWLSCWGLQNIWRISLMSNSSLFCWVFKKDQTGCLAFSLRWGLGGSWQWEDWLIGSWHWQVGSKRRKVVVGRGCWLVNGARNVLYSCFDICVICRSLTATLSYHNQNSDWIKSPISYSLGRICGEPLVPFGHRWAVWNLAGWGTKLAQGFRSQGILVWKKLWDYPSIKEYSRRGKCWGCGEVIREERQQHSWCSQYWGERKSQALQFRTSLMTLSQAIR